MFCIPISAQNTLTITTLKADSAEVQYHRTEYTRSDSMSAGIIRTDTLCSAKDLCVHQDAKISGNVEVNGKIIARGGIVIDTNNVGMYKMYMQLPQSDSTQGNVSKTAMLLIGPLSSGTISPPIDYDPCEGGQNWGVEGSGGIVTKAVRSNVVNATTGMWTDWWTGNGMVEVMGQGLVSSGHGLYVNYSCGKHIYLGTGFGPGGDWRGKAGSKVYMGDYVEMRKKLQIGDPQWGILNAPNNIALEVHTNSGSGIRVKTYTVNDPMLGVFNTNSSSNYGYNGRHTFVVYGDGRVRIRSLENSVPIVSIGQYTSTSSSEAGTENVRIYADGRFWMRSSNANTSMFTLNDGNNDVIKMYGNGKVIIGTQQVVGTHSDALLQVSGKAAAKSFYVLKPTTWADDVFRNKSFIDVKVIEQYITQYHHLPDLPSEEEIKEKGYDVNEMNALLLRKIEELYLIIIQQQKQIEKLKDK